MRAASFLPLIPPIDDLKVVAARGNTLFDFGSWLAVIGVWVVAIYTVIVKVFRSK